MGCLQGPLYFSIMSLHSYILTIKALLIIFIIIDTPFLTVLKTWTLSFEHSVIIYIRVHFEIPKDSAVRLALGSLDLTVLCLVVDQGFVVFAPEGRKWHVSHPLNQPAVARSHRPCFLSIDQLFGRSARISGRSAIYLA